MPKVTFTDYFLVRTTFWIQVQRVGILSCLLIVNRPDNKSSLTDYVLEERVSMNRMEESYLSGRALVR